MRMLLVGGLVGGVFAGVGIGTARAEAPRLVETDYGTYEGEPDGTSTDPAYAVSGNHPMMLMRDVRLRRQADRFPAQLCLRFGMRVMAPPGTELPVHVRVTQPALPGPDGQPETEVSWNMVVDDRPLFAGMVLDQPPDLVPGQYMFEVSSGGEALLRQQFEMLPVRRDAAPLPGCGTPVS